ncbi:MAG: hypothetical protein LBD12_07585 [Clostridiales Family XIII bacterium]|jgi:hypothetical protein|nr:hypothetical protein [Clostridiales Family XIII bacterium]
MGGNPLLGWQILVVAVLAAGAILAAIGNAKNQREDAAKAAQEKKQE